MKLLVTGGAGYIGSVVAARLIEAGHTVVVLDDLSTGHRDSAPAAAAFVEGSIFSASSLLDSSYDGVLHFAARSLVGESVSTPDRYWHNNVGGTQALLDAMRSAGIGRIVFSSTAATYGEPATTPITEDVAPAPTNPYGASKLAVDHLLSGYAQAYDLAAISLRYFNVAGSYGSFRERHSPETHLIPNLLAVAAGARKSAELYGTDYPTHDGTAVRDYLHVVDLADAHILALDSLASNSLASNSLAPNSLAPDDPEPNASKGHRVFNLGTGTGFTVREVLDAVRRVTGHPIPVVERPRRPGDPPTLVASADRARAELGWDPQRSLDVMVRDAWEALQA